MSNNNEEKTYIDIMWIINVKIKNKKFEKYSNDRYNLLTISNYNQWN